MAASGTAAIVGGLDFAAVGVCFEYYPARKAPVSFPSKGFDTSERGCKSELGDGVKLLLETETVTAETFAPLRRRRTTNVAAA